MRYLIPFLVLLIGCSTGGNHPDPVTVTSVTANNGKAGVCIGLTKVLPSAYDGWNGDCPGCDIDSQSMFDLQAATGFDTVLLQNSAANWGAIQARVLEQGAKLKAGELLVLTMSGHGGQIADDSGDEVTDSLDETLCFWDVQLRDDSILDLLNKIKTPLRIAIISDQCHSSGNWRSAWRKITRQKTTARLMFRGRTHHRILQFAGCRENSYSYGSTEGGTWTTCLLQTFNSELTWKQWFEAAKSRMPANQIPVLVEENSSFKSGKVMQ